jgi:hypothetical protein
MKKPAPYVFFVQSNLFLDIKDHRIFKWLPCFPWVFLFLINMDLLTEVPSPFSRRGCNINMEKQRECTSLKKEEVKAKAIIGAEALCVALELFAICTREPNNDPT